MSIIQYIERKTDTKYCEDCAEFYSKDDLLPWKYEKEILLCENCYEQRMIDDEEELQS